MAQMIAVEQILLPAQCTAPCRGLLDTALLRPAEYRLVALYQISLCLLQIHLGLGLGIHIRVLCRLADANRVSCLIDFSEQLRLLRLGS
jgi:hypothetical protein